MRKYLYIAIGGAAGAACRYVLEHVQIIDSNSSFPLNTLLINLSGSFLLTFILTIAFEAWELPSHIRLGISVGFLGAYTTFSTFCKESVQLFNPGQYWTAILYIAISMVCGLGFALLGMLAARNAAKAVLERKRGRENETV